MICNDSIVFCTIIVSLARLQFFKFSLQSSVYFFFKHIISRRQNISVHLIQKQCVHYFDSIGQSYLCCVLIVVGISQWLKKVYRLFCREAEGSCCERCREQCVRKKLWWGRNSCCVVENSPSKYCQDGRSKNHTEINPRNQNTFDSSFVYIVMRVCLSGPSYKIHHSFWHFMLWHFICHRCSKFIFIHFHERLLNFVKFLKINFLSSSSSRKYLQYLSPNFTVFIRIVSFRCIA